MSDFEVRRVGGYRAPKYPAAATPGESPKPRFIANGLSKFAPLALAAIVPMAHGRELLRDPITMQETPAKQPPVRAEIQRLDPVEIRALIGELKEAARGGAMMQGFAVSPSAVLTEQEARTLLTAFFKKNGRATTTVNRCGIRIDVAGETGVAFLPAGTERKASAIEELALLNASGEARVLMIDGNDFTYDPESDGGSLPSKSAVVQRLLAALEELLR